MPASQIVIGKNGLAATVDVPFTINRGGNQTRSLNVATTATVTPGMPLPVQELATSFRIHVVPGTGGRVAWTLGDGNATPSIAVPADGTGAGGAPGERTVDPGAVEIFGLTDDQILRAAAGTLFFRAVCASGTAIVEITLGNGS